MLMIGPIYPARETNIYNIKEDDLVKLIREKNQNVLFMDSFDKIVEWLRQNIEEDDMVITIGAGPINEVANKLVRKG